MRPQLLTLLNVCEHVRAGRDHFEDKIPSDCWKTIPLPVKRCCLHYDVYRVDFSFLRWGLLSLGLIGRHPLPCGVHLGRFRIFSHHDGPCPIRCGKGDDHTVDMDGLWHGPGYRVQVIAYVFHVLLKLFPCGEVELDPCRGENTRTNILRRTKRVLRLKKLKWFGSSPMGIL
ncbi:hypothetical protein EAI_04897 [Harpegnathos saltator]|uniref:Uncharacterized protein n=1 Tax=Harpegnathos saltator TaxID=610380 RepID=E2BZV5_HARSA|nr:hypothetical protein EAI_04897 [Harpegnathos saltator]